ncbi:MAG: TetR/AcrR family transcriptional regulator [Gammaproteobacteria bacterium]|nr:TetR/AcrR family transcriptional regulator [Gammaproteobacteria bacterium]
MISRKQREINQRHKLILDKSRQLFIEHGYHSVTMDMIAKEMEYSKGTIYQHFNCKECIITTLCIQFCTLVHKLISCVGKQSQLTPRLQMLLIQEAFIMIQEMCQDDVQIKNLSGSQPFCTKVSDELSSQSGVIDMQTFRVVVKIVNQAITNGQLKLNTKTKAEDVAIGCWAMAHGIYMLTGSNGCSSTFELGIPKALLRINSDLYLDGVGWKKYNLTEKRMEFISEFSEKFKVIINEHLPSADMKQEQTR